MSNEDKINIIDALNTAGYNVISLNDNFSAYPNTQDQTPQISLVVKKKI